MPVVTVPSRPSGDPIATTDWPTTKFAEEPNAIGVRPEAPVMRTTAISVPGSIPTTVNGEVFPPAMVAVVLAPGSPAACTTWALVSTNPSAERITPDPSSLDRPMMVSSLTTLGSTLAATCSTDPAGSEATG
ncbi:Uncharacterised protein [Mycobacteroides abscessus subsp. abscessus]|nr:Uncharacterised protein [Mycobacteroides abscessus subsp. abscessus]